MNRHGKFVYHKMNCADDVERECPIDDRMEILEDRKLQLPTRIFVW